MRTLLLICAGFAVLPGVASAQLTAAQQAQNDAAKERAAIAKEQVLIERQRLKDPEYRRKSLAAARVAVARNNPGFAEDLKLSEKELGQLLDLLAEHQIITTLELNGYVLAESMASLRTVDVALGARLSDQDLGNTQAVLEKSRAAVDEYTRKKIELDRRRDDAVAALLGPAGYIRWQQYQEREARGILGEIDERSTANARVSQIQNILQARQPLTEAQRILLMAPLLSGVQREKAEGKAPFAGEMFVPDMATHLKEDWKRREASHQGILRDVAPLLTARQLATLKAEFDGQDAVNRAFSSR